MNTTPQQTNGGGGGPPVAVLRRELDSMKDQFATALPTHMPVERFNRVVMTGIQNNPDLIDCDRKSLWNACMRAAQDGLLPDGREGALVPYKREVQWIPMVGGILKKIRNSGQLKSMTTKCVIEGDQFDYRISHEGEQLLHVPQWNADPDEGNIIAAYCIARTKDDATYILVMSKQQIEKVRAMSRAKKFGPWFEWYDQMAEKTVIRRLSKRLPISADLDDLIRRDDHLYDMDLDATEVREENLLGAKRPSRTDHKVIDEKPDEPSPEKLDEWYQAGWGARKDGIAFKDAPDLPAHAYDAWANGWENCDKVTRGQEAERETQEVEDVEDKSEADETPHDPETGEVTEDEPPADEKPKPEKKAAAKKAAPAKTKEQVVDEMPEGVTPGTQAFRDGHAAFRAGTSIFKVPTDLTGDLTDAWRRGWELAESGKPLPS